MGIAQNLTRLNQFRAIGAPAMLPSLHDTSRERT